jgi:hypothetical protein
LGSKNALELYAIAKASFVNQSIASYKINRPPEPAQFRYKPGFESPPNHYAIRRIIRERTERFTRGKWEAKAKAS